MDDLILFYPVVIVTPKLNDASLDKLVIVSDYCLSKNVLKYYANSDECNNDEVKSVNTFENRALNGSDERPIDVCVLNSFKEKPLSRIKLNVEILLFSIFIHELQRSRTFRLNVLKRLYRYSAKKLKNAPRRLRTCPLCGETLWLMQVNARLSITKSNIIDYKWNKKLEVLINERCELDNAMAWLSTLGGAFSALGDYFVDCAEKAGLISMQQLKLALRLGDPITICQCKIYLAMSLLQRGYYSKAKNLIRELYEFAISSEGSKDFRLKNMCIAVWNKLKYTLSENRKRRCKPKIKCFEQY